MKNINKFIFKILLITLVLSAFTLFFNYYNSIYELYNLSKESYINNKIFYEKNKKVENFIYGYEIKFKLLDNIDHNIYINDILVDKDFNITNIKDKDIYKIKYIFENEKVEKIKYTRKD